MKRPFPALPPSFFAKDVDKPGLAERDAEFYGAPKSIKLKRAYINMCLIHHLVEQIREDMRSVLMGPGS